MHNKSLSINSEVLCRTCSSAKGVDSTDYREVRQKCSAR